MLALEQTETGSLIWQFAAKILQGDILFTPVNDFTQSLMNKASTNFYQPVEYYAQVLRSILVARSTLDDILHNQQAANSIEVKPIKYMSN